MGDSNETEINPLLRGVGRLMADMFPEATVEDIDRAIAEVEAAKAQALANARATPARDYRIRLRLDRIDGPIWLRLLAQLGYAVGVAGDECYGIGDVWASAPRTPESALRMGRRNGMSDEWMRRQLWGE